MAAGGTWSASRSYAACLCDPRTSAVHPNPDGADRPVSMSRFNVSADERERASRTAHIPVRDKAEARAGVPAVRGREVLAIVSAIFRPLRCIRIRTGRIAPSLEFGPALVSETDFLPAV